MKRLLLALALCGGCSATSIEKHRDQDAGAPNSSAGSTTEPGSATGGGSGASSSSGGSAGGTGSPEAGAGGGEPEPVCGDGELNGSEACEGQALGGKTCEKLGYGPGALACKSNCQLDLTGCAPGKDCGNGRIEGAEQCDDGEDNSDTTPNACRRNCSLASCGDSVIDRDEGCDNGRANSDFRADACRSDCQPARCGDKLIDAGEECDGSQVGRATCQREGFTGGNVSCSDECTIDTSRCVTCGNGVAEGFASGTPGYEDCDTKDFRERACTDFGFVGGRLSCTFECQVDTSTCGADPPQCGNDTVEGSETCDGSDLAGKTCADFGFSGGYLTCKNDCSGYSSSRCNTCGNGTIESGEVCDDGNVEDDFTCSADCRQPCGIGYGECTGETSKYCGFDRSGKAVVLTERCDPLKGLSCHGGVCEGTCATASLGSSYLGCDYYPTVTTNSSLNQSVGDFAITVANTAVKTANVTVTKGATTVSTTTVASGDVAVIVLPWTSLAKARTVLEVDGAYRVRTDQPVTVYQYNPLNYLKGSAYTATNDASLLLPTNTWTGNYMVVARNDWSSRPGFYAVVAKEDDTQVTLLPSATGNSVTAAAGVAADGTGTVTLNEGDVLHVTSIGDSLQNSALDLTGTQIRANKPVQVIGGHDCTDIPYNITYCDHLEEAMMPLETLGSDYLVTPPLSDGAPRVRMVRVIATEANTTITYTPPQAGAPTTLTNAGEYAEIQTVEAFEIKADRRLIVAEYLIGQSLDGKSGDPAMVLGVPVQQYRTHYLFHAPTNYQANYVNITAPNAATVTLDGTALSGATPIGATGYSSFSVPLSNAGTGNHVVDSSDRVGITVYGYGQYTSYWYPGGLELTQF